MSERKVLAAAIKSREAFNVVDKIIARTGTTEAAGGKGSATQSVFTEQAEIIWKALGEYYSRDNTAQSADIEILTRQIGRTLSNARHKQAFEEILREIGSDQSVSPANIAEDFVAVRREAAAAKLASALVSNKSTTEVEPLLKEYEECLTTTTGSDSSEDTSREILHGTPLAEITKTYSEGELIKIFPLALNDKLDGGVLRGHHVVVFARPEMGKTMFLVNAVAGFLAQGLVVLYVGNEDPLPDIVLRVVCRLTKKNKFEVLENPSEADALARKHGYDNLILAGLAPGTPREIEALIETYKPDVVLIDQLRNLNVGAGSKEGNYTQQLEKAATAARNLAKRHNVVVVSVTQAGDSASGKAVLEMGDVDSSNTGIPAQADVMVGIGASQEDVEMGRRVLSLPKNKRSGWHGFFPVKVDPALSRMWGGGES